MEASGERARHGPPPAILIGGGAGALLLLAWVPYGRHLAVLCLALALLAALAYLAWHTDPAWLLTAALIGSTFNSNWGELGLPGGLAPDRLILLAAIAGLLLRTAGAAGRPRFRLRAAHWLMAATFVWALGAAIAARTLGEADTLFFLADRLAVPFIVFALAPLTFRTPRHRAGFLAGMVGFGGYLGLTALFQTVGPDALVVPSFIRDSGFQVDRAQGPFAEATVNGVALYACAVAAAIALATWEGRWARAAAGAVLFLCAVGLLFTLTRSVWIATVAATALTLGLVPPLRRLILPVTVAAGIMVLIAFAVFPKFEASVRDRTHNQLTVWERKNVNAAAMEMVSQRPLTGYGIGAFYDQNAEHFQLLDDAPQVVTVETTRIAIHNVFLLFAVEVGLIGVALLVASLLAAVGSALLARGPPELRPWRYGLFAVAAYWAVAVNFAPLGQVFPNMIVMLWAGIVLGGSGTPPAGSPRSDRG